MATLQTTQTTDATGSSASHTGPCTIFAEGTFDSATVAIEISTDDSTFETLAGPEAVFRRPGQIVCNATGTYYLRSNQQGSRSSTSITIKTTQ